MPDSEFIKRRAGVGVINILGFGALVDGLAFVWRELGLGGHFMEKLGKEIDNVVCHGEAAHALVVVPVQVDASQFSSVLLLCDDVKFLEGVTQMFGVLFTDILDSKIVGDEAEGDGAQFVVP